MISPTLESFKKKINSGNLIPIFKNIDIDIENPSLILKNISSEEKSILDKVYSRVIESLEQLNTKKEEYIVSELNSFDKDHN